MLRSPPLRGCALPVRAALHRRVLPLCPRSSLLLTGAMSAPALQIDIQAVFDPMCPWCFFGLRRMQRALAAAPHVSPRVKFVPYVFDKDTPVPPLPWHAYVQLRYPDRAQNIVQVKLPYTRQVAASEGIPLHEYENRPICPTVDALRLLLCAREAGRCAGMALLVAYSLALCPLMCCTSRVRSELQYVEALLVEHFSKGRDTSDHSVLLECVTAAGVETGTAEQALSSPASLAWLWEEDQRARRQLHVTGVPHYVLSTHGAERNVHLSGAVESTAWTNAFADLSRQIARG